MTTSRQEIKPAVLTASQAAEYLCCHPKTVRSLCQKGELRAVKLGAEWRIPIESLDVFIHGKEEEQ